MRQKHTIQKLMMLLAMVLWSSHSVWAVDYIYNIINNSGNVVMRVKSTKTKAYLPDRARTPFAQSYRYYKTLVEAQNDARYGEEVAEGSYGAHAFADNVAISTMGLTAGSDGKYQIYVRYDYEAHNTKVKDNNNQAVRIDGTRAYNFQISTRMVYYSTDTESYTTPPSSKGKTPTVTPKASEPIRVTATSNVSQVSEENRQLPNYKWLFIGTKAGFYGSLGQPDPYDIKIVNVEQYALDKTKVLTAVNTQALPLTPTTNSYLHLAYSTDGAVATNVYRFFFRMIGTQVQVMAAKNLFVYNGENNNPAEGQWYVMNKEKDEPDYNDFHDETCFPSLHMREHGKHEGGNGGDRAVTLYYVRPTHQYVIVGSDGTQRAKAYAPVDDDNTLKVPASIATVVPVTYTYYASLANATAKTSALETLPAVSTAPVIYVRYDYNAGNNPLVKLDGSAKYTVVINDHYVKYDATGAYDSHVEPGSTQEAESGVEEYIWHTWGNDPYGIYVTNEKAGAGNYFTGTSTTGTIALGTNGVSAAVQKTDSYTGHTPGRYYLVASPQYTPSRPSFLFRSVYTGDDDFYTWGYFGTEKTTADDWDGLRPRLFKSSLVGDDNDALRMEIYELRDNNVTYHIIDKQGREVISAANKKVFLALPDEIYSPLVSTYHYYTLDQFNVSDGVYTLKSGATEITDRVTTGRDHIYVTYDAGTEIDLSKVEYRTDAGENKGKYTDTTAATKTKYMIRFLNGQSYYQEDGKDGLTDGVHTTRKTDGSNASMSHLNKKYKAEYAYINGDGGFNIYCDSVRNAQFTNAQNERTRWTWYIDGDIDNDGVVDPYHVHVQAASNVGHPEKSDYQDSNVKGTDNYYDFFRTYYNTTLNKVVTGTISNDPRATNTSIDGGSEANIPTEYMILGSKGRYRLVTTNEINGSHQTVNSVEQYWKLYEVIRKVIQEGIVTALTDKQKAMLASESPALSNETIATLESWGWHQYDSWAYSRPWAGYIYDPDNNTKKDKAKTPNYGSHWYQTFDVGEEFDLIEVVTDPAVILVDNRGWEVFRYPMPTQKNPNSSDNLGRWKFIKSYDSNMVTYHWYKEGRKETGAHLYELSEPAMKADGSGEYTSESLIDFPPNYGDHVGDWYVNYEVKDAYRHIYSYDGSTGKSVPVLIRQNDLWATAASTTTIGSSSAVTINAVNKDNVQITGTPTNDMIWYLAPNTSFYTEMGFESNPSTITYTTEQMCFDPYNVQIRNNSNYFKTAATDATLEKNQHWLANKPYNLGLGDNAKADFTADAGHDNRVPNITNATFMILSDAHDHWRLVPRFDHESAVTNLTGGTPTVDEYIYDFNITANADGTATVTPTSAATATQNISFYPIQRYQFHIRDMASSGSAPDVLTSEEFYAQAGSSLIHQLSNLTAPLPVEYIRAYCEYQGAFTNFDSSTNTYSGEVTSYPPGMENGIELTHIYVPYTVVSTAAFFNTEAEAVASNNWMFLLQGTESVATIFGKKLIDYGMEVRYGFRDAAQSEDIGVDMPDLPPAERSFVWNSGKYGGFHFLRRGGTPTVNVNTGAMTFPEGQESVLSTVGPRRIASKDSTASVYLLSPLNDFRRIAETYMEGSETSFREGSWLWAFIGTPYKFYAINREDALANAEGSRKRLAVAAKTSGKELLVLTDGYQTGEPYNPRQAGAYWFTMSKYAVQTDEEAANTFALQLWDGDNIESNDSCIGKGSSNNEFVKAPKNLIKKGTADKPDIAVMKVSSFRAYPWNWDDKKYQNVTVNIYPGTESSHGALALTKTYTRADRAFIAGDVLDGTDGHFYLRIEAQEDGSWKPNGIVENTMPYDHHLINIPYELRRKFCRYTVAGGSFTVQEVDDETPQVLNVYYTVDTEHAPLFIAESELADFRQYITAGKDAPYKDGKKYSDYFYFLDQNHQLTKHLYANDKKGYSEATRFSATNDPKQLMWYFVGDPYNVRLFNVYTDLNSEETRNFVRHRYADKMHSTGYSEDETNDNKTYMENVKNKVFYWEMVDTWAGVGKGELDSTHVNVSYRKDLLMGKSFALRMKMTGSADPAAVISDATYYYLNHNAQTGGENIYKEESGGSLSPKMNTQTSFPTYPDNRHSANNSSATLTPLKPTKVKVTVFDPDEPNRKVTDDEVSDYFAVTDHFKGVPDNLQRKHCEYWWVSTDPDPKSTNMVDENLYFTVTDENPHIYVRYREDATSPFSTLVDGVPVLKRDASLNPWYNMNIGNWWAFFNSSLDGKTYLFPNVTPNVFNNSTVAFVYKGNTLPNTTDKFHKGLQWALVGDPYNFTLRNGRDRMRTSSLDSERDPAYLNQTAISTEGTTWTWIRNGVKNTAGQYEYFLSESSGRRTEIAAEPSGANTLNAPRRILPSDYTISAQSETRNFTVTDGTGASSGTGISNIATGDNYTIGSNMFLTSVTSEGANNESFDAIVNVYNKMNELVATTGWTELARSNAEWNGSLPVDVRRWGCTYHYWADETMTRYPFRTYNQTDASGNYLVKDGGTVYVTYDYDESLYSSENEYRWVNLFFNWDDEHKEWTKDAVTEKQYTAEFWEYNDASGEFEKRHEYPVNATQPRWVEHHLYTDTQEGWIESPKESGTYDKNKAYAYWDQGQYTETENAKSQKWAMIGDPYKFILYNYNRKAEAGTRNSYYLYRSPLNAVENKDFTSYYPYTRDTYEGLYWTWKVDGTRYTFAEGDAEHHKTTFGPREGLPESFYQDYAGAEASSDLEVKKAGYSIETGYLANCRMGAQSLYDKNNLVGSVLGYASYQHKYLVTTELTKGTGDEAPLDYITGTKEKFHEYKDDDTYAEDAYRDYTDVQTVVKDGNSDAVPPIAAVTWTEEWRRKYGGAGYDEDGKYTSGEFEGYYVGPTESLRRDKYEKHTTYKSVQDYNRNTVTPTDQNLTLETNLTGIARGDIHVPRFLVMPMAAQAKSITFHLQTDTYSDGTATQSLRSPDDIVFDHTSENYGVGNTIALPWMMRRQYCDYDYFLIDAFDKDDASNNLAAQITANRIDDLTHEAGSPSNTHRLDSRSESAYTSFWSSGTDLKEDADVYNNDQKEFVVPEAWKDKDVFILVKYKPTAEFEAMKSTGANAAKWLNIKSVNNGNMMRYTRSNNVTAASRDSLNDVTNDYLWAIEGDPYGFKLHNRYADHGFNGEQNERWSTVMTTNKVNSTENYNYLDGVNGESSPLNPNFTYNANGDPVIKSGITYGAKGTADAYGTMSTTATNDIYEAMTGNYNNAMLIHPVNACINVRNQNGYKYYSAFMFNGSPTGDPVQLNYLQDWEVMRNAYANWTLNKPTAAQLLPYYNKAGFVGGLKADVAANTEFSYNEETIDVPALFSALSAGTATAAQFNTAWSLVQDPKNLVALQDGGYYRLKPYSAGNGVVGGQYVSGYLHKLEKTAASPIHLYEQVNQSGNLTGLDNYSGNEWAAGFEQKIEVMDPEYDPSSIFRVSRENIGGKSYVTLETQGLAISDNGMADLETLGDNPTEEQVTAYNASATVASQRFELQDIGLAAFQMRTKANVSGENAENRYLSYNPKTMKYGLNATANELNISEGVYQGATVKTHDTKWVLEPVGTTTANAAGVEYQHPLKVKLTHMGSQDYFTSVCFPFDVTLPRGAYAYSCQGNVMSTGGEKVIDGQKYRQLNIVQIAGEDMETVSKDWEVKSNNQVIPAGVPALLYADGNHLLDGGVVGGSGNTVIVPLILGGEFTTEGTTEQTASVLNSLKNSPLKYSYLTGELTNEEITGDELVFVFGKFNGKLGFMRNANLDYTGVKNNRFLLHNKIYYLYDPTPSGSSANFVTIGFGEGLQIPDPVVDGVEEVIAPADVKRYEHDAIYDLQGRRVPRITQPGIYIINGRKVAVKRVNMD